LSTRFCRHLLERPPVDVGPQAGFDDDRHVRARRHGRGDRGGHLLDVGGRRAVGLGDLGGQQHVLQQPGQALLLLEDRAEQPLAARAVEPVTPLEQREGRPADAGERGAELVRDGADQVVAQPLGVVDARLDAALPGREGLAGEVLGLPAELVGPPEQHQDGRLGPDGQGVDRGPRPVLAPAGAQGQPPVVRQDEGDRQRVHRPVLVEGDDGDGDEEVDVRLRGLRPEVDDQGRAGEQAERGGQRAHPAAEAADARADEQGQRQQDVPQLAGRAGDGRPDGQHGQVRAEQEADGGVPPVPVLLAQQRAARQPAPGPAAQAGPARAGRLQAGPGRPGAPLVGDGRGHACSVPRGAGRHHGPMVSFPDIRAPRTDDVRVRPGWSPVV
jgi:hypothetical protein